MKIGGQEFRTVWLAEPDVVRIIDQRALPFRLVLEDLRGVAEVATAIREMHVRGAGCIGATAGYGMYLAAREAAKNQATLPGLAETLRRTRPTAVNLHWAIERQLAAIALAENAEARIEIALATAQAIAEEDAAACLDIGQHGLVLLEALAAQHPGRPLNILTHCNAGWLAFVDHGSATAPIYAARERGLAVHVWVDETRPRNQGARLTAWELGQQGVPHTIITDNAGGHLMQRGLVDLVITGADRVTRVGDVANKIGTYLKALAAQDNGVPFYVALPSSTFDWKLANGLDIPIEQRDAREITHLAGWDAGEERELLISAPGSPARNDAFDVTPARLITGLITEHGVHSATEADMARVRFLCERTSNC